MEDLDIYFKVVRNRRSVMLDRTNRFCLLYQKDHIIWSIPNTLGVMIFAEFRYAERFLQGLGYLPSYNNILKVKALSPTFYPQMISSAINADHLEIFYNSKLKSANYNTPPFGTLCTKGVHVLT